MSKNNRPQLAAALALAKKQKATLVIAKLDRLARNVHFISGLLESNVQFVAADMPEADRTFLQMAANFLKHQLYLVNWNGFCLGLWHGNDGDTQTSCKNQSIVFHNLNKIVFRLMNKLNDWFARMYEARTKCLPSVYAPDLRSYLIVMP